MIIEHAIFFFLGADSVLAAEVILKILTSRSLSTHRHSNSGLRMWQRFLQIIYGRVPGWAWVAIAFALMAFWHLPHFFTMAVLNSEVHIIQHISFSAVGAAGFVATRLLGESLRIALLITIIGMMGFAGLLFSVFDRPLYPPYNLVEHKEAGGYMVLISTLLLLVGLPVYLVKRSMSYVRSVSPDNYSKNVKSAS